MKRIPGSQMSADVKDNDELGDNDELLVTRHQIAEGYRQAQAGELVDGATARREIQAMKEAWRLSRC